jgi:hypothetical protein
LSLGKRFGKVITINKGSGQMVLNPYLWLILFKSGYGNQPHGGTKEDAGKACFGELVHGH